MKLQSFNNWKILTKIISISVATTILIVAISMAVLLPFIENKLMHEKEVSLKNIIDLTYHLIKEYDDRATKGEFSVAEG